MNDCDIVDNDVLPISFLNNMFEVTHFDCSSDSIHLREKRK